MRSSSCGLSRPLQSIFHTAATVTENVDGILPNFTLPWLTTAPLPPDVFSFHLPGFGSCLDPLHLLCLLLEASSPQLHLTSITFTSAAMPFLIPFYWVEPRGSQPGHYWHLGLDQFFEVGTAPLL